MMEIGGVGGVLSLEKGGPALTGAWERCPARLDVIKVGICLFILIVTVCGF